jgi:hypothetical protein
VKGCRKSLYYLLLLDMATQRMGIKDSLNQATELLSEIETALLTGAEGEKQLRAECVNDFETESCFI